MRRWNVLAMAWALGILVASPAQAKWTGTVRIRGPGLSEPIVLRDPIDLGRWGSVGWAQLTGLFNWPEDQAPGQGSPLGPRYEARFAISDPSRDGVLLQQIYPYAQEGPYVYMPPGQRVYGDAAPSGWNRAGEDLLQALMMAGLPRASPVPLRDLRTEASSGPGMPPWLIPAGVLLLGGLALMASRGRLGRRRGGMPRPSH